MTCDLETQRVVGLRCLEIHHMIVSVSVLLLLLLFFFWKKSSSLRLNELPWWFFQAYFR